jgi:hypothetical protein
METKHTPGPWYVTISGLGVATTPRRATANICDLVCDFTGISEDTEDEALANAEFIVRACNSHEKLLEACKWAAKSPHHPTCPQDGQHCNCHVGAAQTAIGEAEK